MDSPAITISIFLLPCLLQFLLPMHANSYVPLEDLAVSCGASESISFQNRQWNGDVNPKLFSTSEPKTNQQSQIFQAPASPKVDPVPYGNVRIFRSNFTYSFPLTTNGPKFLRLHFYPTTYPNNLGPYNSLFSVTAGDFTLLKDFNASLWLVDPTKDTVSIEYCINVVQESKRLDLKFVPTTNYYAFINGIEVVSMPPFLYYSDPNGSPEQAVQLVDSGIGSTDPLGSKSALETVYRVNVGQNQVPTNHDTGMFREWETDYPRYLEKEHPQSVQTYFDPLNYTNEATPNYTAPDAVYQSSRSYGLDATDRYNVTWNFQVDSKFTYMVRLHFCVWAENVQNDGDLKFEIIIAEAVADDYFDVIAWSGGNKVPSHKDYAVWMVSQGDNSEKVNLSIKLQRLKQGVFTRISDVLLNGIEIFKISDTSSSLAGPNPDPLLSPAGGPPPGPLTESSRSSSKKTILIVTVAVVAVAVAALLLASIVGIFVFRRRREADGVIIQGSTKKTEGSSSQLPSHLCRYFSIAEIRAATNNFDDMMVIGAGGFGDVYKGYIDDGSIPVAIKRLKQGSQQGFNEFMNEIEMLSQLRHLHLVSLIGYCNDGGEMILVYDFMQRGTLREYLYGSDNKPLSWKQRLEILLGSARGLQYLHAGAEHNIIHRDVKSTNILLDERWVAKVSDFGLSKVGPTGTSMTHVSTMVKGSVGYLDPEYYKRQRLTLKSDVYSFGVVLLEALCARPPLVRDVDKHKASLVDWFRRCSREGKLDQTVDPFLKDSVASEGLKWYADLALSCLHEDGNQRPSMSDIVGSLEFGMQLVVAEEEDIVRFGGSQYKEKGEEKPLVQRQLIMRDEGSDVVFTSSDESGSKNSKVTSISASSEEEQMMLTGVVFSEIGDPRAR